MLGENIKRCRKAMGLSQEELAIKFKFEWVFIRIAPIILLSAVGGIFLIRKSS